MCIDEYEDSRRARRAFSIGDAEKLTEDVAALNRCLISSDGLTVREVLCRIEVKVQQIRNAMAAER